MAHTSRRAFAKAIAAATAAVPLLGTEAVAQPHPVDALKPSPLAEALVEVVRADSGRHLTAPELDEIENDFARSVKAIGVMREFKLTNADEPDFTFAARVRRS